MAVTPVLNPLPNYTPGTAQQSPLPNYTPGTAQQSPLPSSTPNSAVEAVAKNPLTPSGIEQTVQAPEQLKNPPIPPTLKQAAQKAPPPPTTVYEGPHIAPIHSVASSLGANYQYNPATNEHTVNGTPVKPTSVVNGVAHAPVQQVAHAAQVPAQSVKTSPNKVKVTAPAFKPGQTAPGYKGAFVQSTYNPHFGQEEIFRQNAQNGYYNYVYDANGHLIASYFHANPAPPPPPIAQVGATVPGYQGTFLQSSYNPKFGQEEIFKQQAQNGYYTNVYDKNGKLLASYYHGNPQGGHEGTLMGFGQQVGAAPGNAVYQEKVNGGYYNNVYNPQGKLVATYFHPNPPADTSSQPQGFQFDPTLDAMQQFQYLNPIYQQMMQQEDQKINDMMNKRGLYNSGIAQQDVDTQDQAIEQKEWDAINKQVAADRAEAFKEYNDQLTQQLNWQKALLPYQYPTMNSMLPYTMGPTPAQMLPYMYPTANTMVPYMYGPTPYQQQSLSLNQMKALLPYEAMTQYQQAQIGLGRDKLAAQVQQWAAQDQLKQEDLNLRSDEFQWKVQYDTNMANIAAQNATTNTAKAQLTGLHEQLTQLGSYITNKQAQDIANHIDPSKDTDLQNKLKQYNDVMNQISKVVSGMGSDSSSGYSGGGGHPLATPN
jgi:hypothetical protein